MANVKAYFSCLKPSANKLDRLEDRFRSRLIEYAVINQIGGRLLLSVIGQRNDLTWMVEKFTELDLDPIVIAAFRADTGRKLRDYPVNRVEWRRVAPDIQIGVNELGEPIYARPPVGDFRQVHTWDGWPLDSE